MSGRLANRSDRRARRSVRLPLVPLVLLALGALALGAGTVPAAAQSGGGRVDVVRVEGTITPPMARYVGRAIDRGAADGAAAVVLEVDTPGGLSSAMDDIIDDIVASEVPVVVFVAPNGARAASAGVFIAYAGHVAAMAPGTRIGSASPVFLDGGGGGGGADETMVRKVTNDAVSQIKNLAQLRDRNAEWAEQAVREAVNVTAEEAERLRVVDVVAPDVPALLARIDGRTVETAAGPVTLATAGAETRRVGMGWLDQLLQLLADPTVAYILLSLGSLGLVLELSNPGAIVPGVVGGLGLLLGLFGLGTLPVNWTGVLLIGFGFLLLAVDLFVPSFGALTVGGLVSFVIGSYLLIGEGAPPGFDVSPAAIWTMTALLLGFFLFLTGSVLRARLRRPATGREALVGEIGEVRRPVPRSGEGMVFLRGELWRATLAGPGAELPAGTAVAVAAVD
ncbi:MAG: nodulation protein NfeD, partial [Chloroflexota bacterium]|nr:nodulation protein NfeD [Chloroflexota bacterium]